MTNDRIKEIQSKTAHPDSISVQQGLLQVWNECKQEQLRLHNVSDLLIAWEQFKNNNWWESEAINVEKVLMNKFSAIYGR